MPDMTLKKGIKRWKKLPKEIKKATEAKLIFIDEIKSRKALEVMDDAPDRPYWRFDDPQAREPYLRIVTARLFLSLQSNKISKLSILDPSLKSVGTIGLPIESNRVHSQSPDGTTERISQLRVKKKSGSVVGELTTGTDVPYADIHEFGGMAFINGNWTNVRPRPFFRESIRETLRLQRKTLTRDIIRRPFHRLFSGSVN